MHPHRHRAGRWVGTACGPAAGVLRELGSKVGESDVVSVVLQACIMISSCVHAPSLQTAVISLQLESGLRTLVMGLVLVGARGGSCSLRLCLTVQPRSGQKADESERPPACPPASEEWLSHPLPSRCAPQSIFQQK